MKALPRRYDFADEMATGSQAAVSQVPALFEERTGQRTQQQMPRFSQQLPLDMVCEVVEAESAVTSLRPATHEAETTVWQMFVDGCGRIRPGAVGSSSAAARQWRGVLGQKLKGVWVRAKQHIVISMVCPS
jgi:hypothetical protein